MNNSTASENDLVSYFTELVYASTESGIGEIIAETNAIISGKYNNEENVGIRTVVLQENFPRTIVYIAQKINS